MIYSKRFLIIVLLMLSSVAGFTRDSTQFIWDKIAFEVLFIRDSTLIREVTRELLIPLKVKPQQIALVDLNFNGPGIKDIVVVYPSHQVFTLDFLPEKVAKTIRKWPRPDYEMLLAPNDTSIFKRLKKIDAKKAPLAPVLANLSKIVKHSWADQPVKLFYTQSSENLKIEVLRLKNDPEPFWTEPDSTAGDSTRKTD